MGDNDRPGLTRRDFLRGSVGALAWGTVTMVGQGPEATAQDELRNTNPKVVIARDPAAITSDGTRVDEARVQGLLTQALNQLTGKTSLSEALAQFIKPTDKVGIKSNVMMLPVHDELLIALWSGLQQLGVPPENVITWDRGAGHKGYVDGEAISVSFDAQHISTVCSEFADVLINVTGLKTHWLSGIGICLKNWAGAVSGLNVRDENTPWPIHQDSCADLGMLQAHPTIRDKMRLCIVDGLQGLYHGGPQVNPQYLWPYAGLIVGTDAVAVDRVCLKIIEEKRREIKGEDWPVNPPAKHIQIAAEKYHLGEANLDRITIVELPAPSS
ncbi:MAG: DUF362 domain-containing protein [Candidatus Zipacnadales bacterium]